ncbi:MAG TPA: hypothetical protein P5556_10900, partial [Candidatus Gastranaerophilales bacterium]|nr:hypothetical protein [Candidatus Gastranaerophilales bacterium]
LTPNQRDLSIKILMVLDSVPQFEEGSPIDEFKEFIKALPKQVEFDEIATKKKQDKTEPETVNFENASEDSLEIYNQAKLMSEKEGISFRDALLKLHK